MRQRGDLKTVGAGLASAPSVRVVCQFWASDSFRVLNARCPCFQGSAVKQHRLQLVSPHDGAVIGVRTDAFRWSGDDTP